MIIVVVGSGGGGSSSNTNMYFCCSCSYKKRLWHRMWNWCAFIYLSSLVLWQSFGGINYPVLWDRGEFLQETSHACSICTLASCSIVHRWHCVIGGLHGQYWVSRPVSSILTWKQHHHQMLSGKCSQITGALLVHIGYHGRVSKFKLTAPLI